MSDTERIVQEILELLNNAKGSIKEVKNVKQAAELIPDVVKAVEEVSTDIKTSALSKRTIATQVLNGLIDIPVLPEIIEEKLIGIAIDAVVAAFNKYIGKEWLNRLLNKTPKTA